eukprot:g11621.t1
MENGQVRRTAKAVARANQNEFDPVRQFYDRAGTLAKQGHTVELWRSSRAKRERGEKAARGRERHSLLQEQRLNETAVTKIIGLTLETRAKPDHISPAEIRRLRRYGCTRVQIGVQHTDDEILKYINRGHDRAAAVKATRLLKMCGFKVDIHLMPDLPNSDTEKLGQVKDWAMFQDVLHGDELQADHWKIYPCEVTPFTRIETWYKEGKYIPYTEKDPKLLTELLARVKAQVHPWIRLNRVIRDIPEVSIVAGNALTNLRQAIFEVLKSRGQSCRCIRCREVRDWPETAEGLRLKVREYRSSGGWEYFISIEGGHRGFGGGATQRALAGGQKATKKEKNQRKAALRDSAAQADMKAAAMASANLSREDRKRAAAEALAKHREELPSAAATEENGIICVEEPSLEDDDNATLYGLLRLRFNDDTKAPSPIFPESWLRITGIGKTLMGTAELIAAAHNFRKISVIAGVGVRNYYRRLGYVLRGDGCGACPAAEFHTSSRPFHDHGFAGAAGCLGSFAALVEVPQEIQPVRTGQLLHLRKADEERRKAEASLRSLAQFSGYATKEVLNLGRERQDFDRLLKEKQLEIEALKEQVATQDRFQVFVGRAVSSALLNDQFDPLV